MKEFLPGIWRSALPRRRDIVAFAAAGGQAVLDLTQRPRPVVERACLSAGIGYRKSPVSYSGAGAQAALSVALSAGRPLLVHCFHGRDRTGLLVRLLTMCTVGRVVLHRVGRNLNRAVRTCEAFGVRSLLTHRCAGGLSGNLYGAKGRVDVAGIDKLPVGNGVLALETGTLNSLDGVDFETVDTLLLGGESSGLPRGLPVRYATIPMQGRVSGLTVEGALAIALYEWGRPSQVSSISKVTPTAPPSGREHSSS